MRCPVPLLAAWCWVALPHALLAQPAPTPTRSPAQAPSAATDAVAPETAETKSLAPLGQPAAPAAAGAVGQGSEATDIRPGDEVEEPASGQAASSSDVTQRAGEQEGASATAEQNELRARIEAIGRGEPLDESVQRPLDFAKAALERSRASRAVGDTTSEARTQKLSRAAVALAEARLRLLRERSLYLSARGRHDGASAELAIAQRALERERARARELQRASAVP